MKNNDKKTLTSISAYARKCGVSRAAIHKAIDSGKIVKGYDKKKKKIIVEVADQEYGLNVQVKKINERIKDNISQNDLETYAGVEVMDIQLLPDDTSPEADRKQKIIKAQLDLLKLKTQSGELINKEEAYKEMFAYGKEIRSSFQNLPSRIIDQLLSLDRDNAYNLLATEINDILTTLSGHEN